LSATPICCYSLIIGEKKKVKNYAAEHIFIGCLKEFVAELHYIEKTIKFNKG